MSEGSLGTGTPMRVGDLSAWARGDGLEIVLLVLGAMLLARAMRSIARRAVERLEPKALDPRTTIASEEAKHIYALVQAVERMAVGLVWFITAFLVLVRCNVPITTLVAPATVAGVGLGFGAQRIVGDLLGGFFLISERQYGVGDVIQVQPAGQLNVTGTVEEISLRVTKIRTATGDVVTIANGEIREVVNRSKDWSKVVLDLPIPTTEDVDHVSTVLREVGNGLMDEKHWHDLLLEPPAVLGVESLDLDRMQVRLSARTLPGKQWEVGRELRRRSVMGLRRAGIAMSPEAITG